MTFSPPKKLSLARVPTPIMALNRVATKMAIGGLFVKRDDLTGVGVSGNKIRKLEYLLAEALRREATTVITCGGIQSNHARATAIAAVQRGLKSVLVLRGEKSESVDGNLFLDKLVGARIKFITPEQYKGVDAIMEREAKRLEGKGEVPYIIPEGGSNEVGLLGYIDAMREIRAQERKMPRRFDYIVTAVGSGGTLSGLVLGKKLARISGDIIGFNVCDTAEHFMDRTQEQMKRACKRWKISGSPPGPNEYRIIDGYVGPGYSIPYKGSLCVIKDLAHLEGIFLDPVYTSKAFYGLLREIGKGTLKRRANYLFIHTGGIFGLLAQRERFSICKGK